MSKVTTPDEADRIRIETDLDTNLLVEAGAGSGKTRGLVERMLALIARARPTLAAKCFASDSSTSTK